MERLKREWGALMEMSWSDWAVLVGALLFVLLVVGGIVYNIWNFLDCFNKPIAQAPARCLSLGRSN